MLLTRYCLKNPIAVTLFFIALAAIGLTALVRMGRSTLPPVSIPIVTVAAPYAGAGPAQIERLVIEPIEDQVNSIPDVSRVSASAQNGFAQVVIQFRFGTNVDVDRANVQQAVDASRANMPPDLVPPVVSKDDLTQAPVLDESVSSALLNDAQISDLLTQKITPALRATAGVGTVLVSGERVRQFTIAPLTGPLNALHGTPLDVLHAAQGSNDVFPGGFLRSRTSEAAIGINAAATSTADLALLPVAIPGNSLARMRDVASVEDGYADATTVSRVDGETAAIIFISHASGSDSLRTIAGVRKTFRRLSAQFPLVRFEELRSDEPFTNAAIDGVLQTLGEGIVLTVLVMLLFLHAWRSAVIAAIAIPTSLAAAFATMWALGFTLNVLSLMGLSLTIGILVDDSIVIIEAITRNAGAGRPADEAALAGRRELGAAAFAITLVDVAVFTPIALMPGLIGEFMREFGLVIVFATAFSLFVAYTLTPLLAARWALVGRTFMLNGRSYSAVLATLQQRARTFPWMFRRAPLLQLIAAWHAAISAFNNWERDMAERYAMVWLSHAWKARRFIAVGTVVTCLAGFSPLVLGAIPTEFSPPINRGAASVDVSLPAGTSLTATDAAALKITDALLADPAVGHIESTAGRAFNGNSDVFASNVAELRIVLGNPTASPDGITAEVKRLNYLVPQASIAGAGKGMGGSAAISYSVGGNSAVLSAAARRILSVLRANPYATDVRSSNLGLAPALNIRTDNERSQLLNVSTDDAAQTARIATAGALAARARLASGLVDVVVRSDGTQKGDLDAITRQNVRSSDGRLVPLADVTQITTSRQPVVIERENGQRIVTISANATDGTPISAVTGSLSRKLRDPNFLPAGAKIAPRGDVEQFLDTVTRMFAALAMSLVFVYMILAVLYRSYTLPLIIMATVPLASIGAFGTLFVLNALKNVFPAAHPLQYQTLNLYSMLGIIMLVGLVAKNGVLLVEYAERYVRAGQSAFDAMTAAAQLRFKPIVMTTCAMIAGMLPLAVGETIGAEYRRALGTVVVGGLTSSLLLTLFVVPMMYIAYRGRCGSLVRRNGLLQQPPQPSNVVTPLPSA